MFVDTKTVQKTLSSKLQSTVECTPQRLVNCSVMNIRTDRQTDRIHILHIYVELAQARPNHSIIYWSVYPYYSDEFSLKYTVYVAQNNSLKLVKHLSEIIKLTQIVNDSLTKNVQSICPTKLPYVTGRAKINHLRTKNSNLLHFCSTIT